jgi:recombination associated protein RdgC
LPIPKYDLDGDFIDVWQDKLFLGQEFLTWLWLNSLVDSHFSLKKGQINFDLWFENTIKLESGSKTTKRSVTCQSSNETIGHQWAEAFAAVMDQKMISSGRIRIKTNEKEWLLTLPADTIAPKSVKITVETNLEGENAGHLDQIGQLLDRLSLLMELNSLIEELLATFLTVRLSKDWETKEIPRLSSWLLKWDQQARGLAES